MAVPIWGTKLLSISQDTSIKFCYPLFYLTSFLKHSTLEEFVIVSKYYPFFIVFSKINGKKIFSYSKKSWKEK